MAFVISGTYQINGSVYKRVLATDATLKATSTIKGIQVILNTPRISFDEAVDYPSNINVPAVNASDTSNMHPYKTLFDPTSGWATVKAVFYPGDGTPYVYTESEFNTLSAYANQSINVDGFFVIKVTAENGAIYWYIIGISLT